MIERNLDYLVSLVFSLHRLLQDKMRREGKNFSSFLQFKTLQYIEQQGKPGMKDIADFLSITPPSATSLIENLANAGKIERVADPNDRRIVRLKITPAGKQTIQETMIMMNERMKTLLSRLNDEEVSQLTAILEKFLK